DPLTQLDGDGRVREGRAQLVAALEGAGHAEQFVLHPLQRPLRLGHREEGGGVGVRPLAHAVLQDIAARIAQSCPGDHWRSVIGRASSMMRLDSLRASASWARYSSRTVCASVFTRSASSRLPRMRSVRACIVLWTAGKANLAMSTNSTMNERKPQMISFLAG